VHPNSASDRPQKPERINVKDGPPRSPRASVVHRGPTCRSRAAPSTAVTDNHSATCGAGPAFVARGRHERTRCSTIGTRIERDFSATDGSGRSPISTPPIDSCARGPATEARGSSACVGGKKNVVVTAGVPARSTATLVGFSSPRPCRDCRLGMTRHQGTRRSKAHSFHIVGLSPSAAIKWTDIGAEEDARAVEVVAVRRQRSCSRAAASTTVSGHLVDWASGSASQGALHRRLRPSPTRLVAESTRSSA